MMRRAARPVGWETGTMELRKRLPAVAEGSCGGAAVVRFPGLGAGDVSSAGHVPEHESRTTQARYAADRGAGTTQLWQTTVNQRFLRGRARPRRSALGAVGTVTVDATQSIRVTFTGGSDGNLAADAVRLQRAVLHN